MTRDCGQDVVCMTPPGCARHWEERCRELVAEAEALLARVKLLIEEREMDARDKMALRTKYDVPPSETWLSFVDRVAGYRVDGGGLWRCVSYDTAYGPPFRTIRACRVCGCLVAGGPTACVRCAEKSGSP